MTLPLGWNPLPLNVVLPQGADFVAALESRNPDGDPADWAPGTVIELIFDTFPAATWPASLSAATAFWLIPDAETDLIPTFTRVTLWYRTGTTDIRWAVGRAREASAGEPGKITVSGAATVGIPGSPNMIVLPVAGPPGPAGPPGGAGPSLAYTHTQAEPSTVWLITHPLLFIPAAVSVRDQLDATHHPIVSWPQADQVRLDFDVSVEGIARLS